jgi:hypothetical protein
MSSTCDPDTDGGPFPLSVKLEDVPVATEQLPADDVKLEQLKMVVWAEAGIRNPNVVNARNKYLFVTMSIHIDLESNGSTHQLADFPVLYV